MNGNDDDSAARLANDDGASGGSFRLRNIRTAEALARFGGDETRLRYWLLDFASYGASLAAQIEQAVANDSLEIAINRAHALKGRTGMLGMIELHSIVRSLELSLRNGEPAELWIDELTRSVAETNIEITRVLGRSAA